MIFVSFRLFQQMQDNVLKQNEANEAKNEAKDAANAEDKKIFQLEQELQKLSNLNEVMLLVGVCMFSAFCLVLSVLPLPCLHDFCFFPPVSANA
jgi:hypothetical protein